MSIWARDKQKSIYDDYIYTSNYVTLGPSESEQVQNVLAMIKECLELRERSRCSNCGAYCKLSSADKARLTFLEEVLKDFLKDDV